MNRRFWTEGPGSFILAILIALSIRWAFMEAYVIPTPSMLPSLLVHDHIFVNKLTYGLRVPFTEKWFVKFAEPQRGEILVFKDFHRKSKYYIKRVIGLPGDKVFYQNGNLYVNDQLVQKNPPDSRSHEMDWVRDADFSSAGEKARHDHWEERLGDFTYSVLLKKNIGSQVNGPFTVPEEHYFVMGDNRDHSSDSRHWVPAEEKYVPRDNIVGRAMFVWLSCDETLSFVPFLCHPGELRWNRFFHTLH